MNRRLLIFRQTMLLVIAFSFHAADAAETIPPVGMFALPKVEIRKSEEMHVKVEAERGTGSAPGGEGVKEELSVSVADNALVSETSIHAWESMNDAPLLRQVEQAPELGGAIGWVQEKVWDPVFAPEVVEFGKVKMTGGIVAAIKRKNPFCLLHPLAFAASW